MIDKADVSLEIPFSFPLFIPILQLLFEHVTDTIS